MGVNITRTLLVVGICAFCTVLERALPFLIFRGREVPKVIRYLGRVLPMAIMVTLVIFCIKDISFTTAGGWAPYVIATAFTAALHWFLKNALLSIAGGTICYMLLIQLVFV